ncbi:uncharacterized protein Dsimw501_GD27888, isoform A [Drosophila simulans]|uniref:Uncharacterized protein, isoform A n=1 Tax=Drosophila simulans TaxID=7240 RepID=A0A0J9RVM8_DROSI|nr:uncharacterized protein Dsimw501_GD27888, isoform A [Drosophila simulans]
MWRELRQLPPPTTSLIQPGACISHRRNEDDSRPKGTPPAQRTRDRARTESQPRRGSKAAPRQTVS